MASAHATVDAHKDIPAQHQNPGGIRRMCLGCLLMDPSLSEHLGYDTCIVNVSTVQRKAGDEAEAEKLMTAARTSRTLDKLAETLTNDFRFCMPSAWNTLQPIECRPNKRRATILDPEYAPGEWIDLPHE